MRRWYKRRAIQRLIGVNGKLAQLANAFVWVETTRLVLNGCVLLAGVGVLIGGPYRYSGYLLAVVPLISMVASIIALRSFD